jgi:hypothetical protein
VYRFLVDGSVEHGLVGEVFRPSEKLFVTRSRLRQAASCAGFLARSCDKPADLAASETLALCVAKFLSNRERFAPSRDTQAWPAGSFPILPRKKSGLISPPLQLPFFGLVGWMPD